jgi:hypothetical protein
MAEQAQPDQMTLVDRLKLMATRYVRDAERVYFATLEYPEIKMLDGRKLAQLVAALDGHRIVIHQGYPESHVLKWIPDQRVFHISELPSYAALFAPRQEPQLTPQ